MDENGRRGDWFGGPPPRAERGGVRYLLLDAILERPRHGYEIISVIEERSHGAYRPSPGVVYPTMQMLEELAHARAIEIEGRKVYEITEAGQRDLEAHRAEVNDFYARLYDESWETQLESFGEVARLMGQLMKTVRRAARRGRLSSRTLARVREVVLEAIQKLEQIFETAE
jgi:DNA-binding PadR family transcriptional regulator